MFYHIFYRLYHIFKLKEKSCVSLPKYNLNHSYYSTMIKTLNTRLSETERIEFWIALALLFTSLVFNIYEVTNHQSFAVVGGLANNNQTNGYAQGYVQVSAFGQSNAIAAIIFAHAITLICYLMLCFYTKPAFESATEKASNTLFVFIFIAVFYVTGIINIFFAALLAIKMLFIYFGRNRQNLDNALYHETALLTACYILLRTIFIINGAPDWLHNYIHYTAPSAIVFYLFLVHYLLPLSETKKRPLLFYWSRLFLIILLTIIGIIAWAEFHRGISNPGDVMSRNLLSILFVNIVARMVYKKRQARYNEEITALKSELGKTDASLSSLKAQINPHFLFNALNTLFGTALQENAERTSEGIQRLGDMMRFMLQENMQDQILLTRDVDYLQNYIQLQKLRTSTTKDVVIETQITEPATDLLITPMLLIPFVENAFKHGISLQNPSHIKITLQVNGNTLHFDVYNSIHLRADNDPEKGRSGIGLDNVKQRLALMYPQRHELAIHNNGKEFFVHLTMQLEAIN